MNALQRALTADEFATVFGRLASQLRWLDHRPTDIANYFDALRDLPENIIHESAKRIASQAGRKFFPTTGEWREVALVYESELRRAELSSPRTWENECNDCEDTGWNYYDCPGDVTCDRTNPHLPHSYVRPCPCRATNRTYQRHHAPRDRSE
jgi:hypothetical protein